jgi:hypothetical protein
MTLDQKKRQYKLSPQGLRTGLKYFIKRKIPRSDTHMMIKYSASRNEYSTEACSVTVEKDNQYQMHNLHLGERKVRKNRQYQISAFKVSEQV